MAAEFVLDTFAVNALLRDEPGAGRVRKVLESAERGEVVCRFSGISVGEACYIVERQAGARGVVELLALARRVPLIVEEVTPERILAAAHVKAQHPLSFANAFAVALTQEYGATVLTGDPEFRSVEAMVTVEWLPRR